MSQISRPNPLQTPTESKPVPADVGRTFAASYPGESPCGPALAVSRVAGYDRQAPAVQWRLAYLRDLRRHDAFRTPDGQVAVVLFQLHGTTVVSIEGEEKLLPPSLVVEIRS